MRFIFQTKKGIALLIAIIVTASGLTLTLGIAELIYGQLQLSQSAKESHKALYAADMGKECALYYMWYKDPDDPGKRSYWGPLPEQICFYPLDFNGDDIPDDYSNACADSSGCKPIRCAGQTVTVNIDSPPGEFCNFLEYPQQFSFSVDNGELCADVKVVSEMALDAFSTNYFKTTITSSGWNTCTPGSRRVNRVLEYVDCAAAGSGERIPCTP